MKLKINPISPFGGEYRFEEIPTVRKGFTYLHGDLETENGYDCFGVCEPFDWKEGIYPCEVLGIEENAIFYLWLGTDKHLHGLVVSNSDTESRWFAYKMYNKKSTVL